MALFKVCVIVAALVGLCFAGTKQNAKRSLYGSDHLQHLDHGHGFSAYSSGYAAAVPVRVTQSHQVVPVSVPQPYAVPVSRHVPVPVPHPVPVPVPRAVPVGVPHPVPVPVDRPYPVDVPRTVPVGVPHPVPVPVDRPYPVDVPQPYPVEISQHVPFSVPTPVFAHAPSYAAAVPAYGSYGHDDIGFSSLSGHVSDHHDLLY